MRGEGGLMHNVAVVLGTYGLKKKAVWIFFLVLFVLHSSVVGVITAVSATTSTVFKVSASIIL